MSPTMHLPDPSQTLNRRSVVNIPTLLDTSHFTLNISGVLGFFGGDEAISAMSTAHVFLAQRWLGWYNIPGSYQIAKRYGLLTRSAMLKGLFPGDRADLAKLFQFDGLQGPKFLAVRSGATMESTGHLAYLLMKECASKFSARVPGREGPSVGVTVVRFYKSPSKVVFPERIFAYSPIFAIIPILANLAACAACGVYQDWFSCSLILWGILSHGITNIVIGSGTLCFTHRMPPARFPSGDGILGSETEFALLQGAQGEEGAINAVIRGRLSFKFPNERYEEYIGCCSILLTIQFLAQLFLIPQGSLFGQIMFISSLALSWIYTLYLSTLDKEKLQQRILNGILMRPLFLRYMFTTRTSAIVFALLVLVPQDPHKILEEYLPNDSRIWKTWKEKISRRFRERGALYFVESDWNQPGYTDVERRLLRTLYGDAQVAYDAYFRTGGTSGDLADPEWFSPRSSQQSIPMYQRDVLRGAGSPPPHPEPFTFIPSRRYTSSLPPILTGAPPVPRPFPLTRRPGWSDFRRPFDSRASLPVLWEGGSVAPSSPESDRDESAPVITPPSCLREQTLHTPSSSHDHEPISSDSDHVGN